jgi:hypothetical protein
MAYFNAICKINEIRRSEDAMEVIQVVMLIAVGVLAIVAVWAGINGFLEDIWAKITGSGATSQTGPSIPSSTS